MPRFLAELRRTGNVMLSADRAGLTARTFQRRRLRSPAFGTQWDAAIGYARAVLATAETLPPQTSSAKTLGGEYTVQKGRNGEMQVRRAHPGRLSQAGETQFFRELATTCNVALACRAVGITPAIIYRRRLRSDHFADRMDAALAQGHERLEFALMESAMYSLAPDEMAKNWAELGVEPSSPLTVMTFDQVIISMGLHMKRVVLGEKRRAHNERISTAEETDAAIMTILDRLNKRKAALEKCDWETGARAAEVAVVPTFEESGRGIWIAPPDEGSSVRESAGRSARVRLLE